MGLPAQDGVQLHWKEDGNPDGQPIVFSNSLGTDLGLWDGVVARLPANFRIIRYDTRGHGQSPCPPGPYTIAGLSGDIEGLLDQLGVKDCIFVGVSLGGMIGQHLAIARPDLIHAMLLSNTAPKMGSASAWQARIDAIQHGGLLEIADAVMERWFSPAFLKKPDLPKWRDMLIATQARGYVACCQAISTADLSETSKALSLPVLVMAGQADLACPVEDVRALASLISGATLKLMPGVGHLPSVEAPAEFTAHLCDFIEENTNV